MQYLFILAECGLTPRSTLTRYGRPPCPRGAPVSSCAARASRPASAVRVNSNVRPHISNTLALHRFELASVRARLEHLPPRCRVAFALACAIRTARSAAPLDMQAKAALRLAEDFAHGREIDLDAAAQLLAALEAAAVDVDAQSSAIYALSSLCKLDVDSPAWAAECAYNASDAEAQAGLSFSTYTSEVEAQLLADPRVQQELHLQALDLEHLRQGVTAVPAVLSRAQLGAA